jgi:hypothetical protein
MSIDGKKGDSGVDSDEGLGTSIVSSRCRSCIPTSGGTPGAGAAEPVTAVNLKTGCSVVQLDFPSGAVASADVVRKSSVVSSITSKSLSSLRGSSVKKSTTTSSKPLAVAKKILQSKETNGRKLRKTPSSKAMDDNSDSSLLCITQLATPRTGSLVGQDLIGDELEQGANSSSDDPEDELSEIVHDPRVYCTMAANTRSAYRFEKLAYPDLQGGKGAVEMEPLYNRKFGVQR